VAPEKPEVAVAAERLYVAAAHRPPENLGLQLERWIKEHPVQAGLDSQVAGDGLAQCWMLVL
jgi:hypothetical protein